MSNSMTADEFYEKSIKNYAKENEQLKEQLTSCWGYQREANVLLASIRSIIENSKNDYTIDIILDGVAKEIDLFLLGH